ncbi:MAG: hypothetical protein V4683_14970 [Bacteroidota bacterium]
MKKRITLTDISKEAPFKVPEGYFENLNENILKRIEITIDKKDEPKIIQLKPKYNLKKWTIAAAASIGLTFGLYYQTIIKPINQSNAENELAISQISDQQLIQYANNQDIELSDLTENVNFESSDLEDIYFENVDATQNQIDELVEEI